MIVTLLDGRRVRALTFCVIATLLAGCGGGGGGSSTPAPVPVPPPIPNVLTFSAPAVTATVQEGRVSSMTVQATVTTPTDFANASTVFAYVVDTTGVILPDVKVTQLTSTTYSVLLQSAPTLPLGKHTGNFLVKVCKDSACAQQFPGSPMQLPYEITVAPVPLAAVPVSPLNLTITHGKPAPAALTVNVAAKGRTWTAVTTSPWIKLSNASGTGDGAFSVVYDVAALQLGVQNGSIVITGSDAQTVTLPVTAQLLPAAFSVDRGQITFNAINGAPITAESIKFTVADLAASWSAVSSADWLSLTPNSGTTPGVTMIKADPAVGSLASGKHEATLKISAPNHTTSSVPVTLNLTKATLKPSVSSITLGGTYGRDLTTAADLTLNLNTMTAAHPWSFSALPAWLGASASSGSVNQAGRSINFSPVGASLPIGTTTATVTVTAKVNGDTLAVPLTITANRDLRKLLFSEVGVGMASTPSWSRLSRTVTVRDNFGLASTWTASSDKTWLTVQRSANELTLSADPATLPANTISYATVTLATSDTGVTTPEQLQVAIWKGSTTPATTTKLAKSYVHLKTDPIRPLLYANNGNSGIDVYNIYTATLVGTIANLGASMGEMAISPNGDHLYTYDTGNRNIIVVDLKTLSKKSSWPLAVAVQQSSSLIALRPNGVEVVAAADGQAYLASTGAVVGKIGNNSSMTASSDGTRLYVQDSGFSPASVRAYAIDFAAFGGGALFSASAASTSFINGASNGQDIAVSADGTRLYVASGAPYRCSSVKPSNLSFIGSLPGGDAYPNNVEVGSDGRVYCGISGWYSPGDVWMHSAEGALIKSFKFAGYAKNLITGSLGISADGLMMVGQTNDPALVFVPVGP